MHEITINEKRGHEFERGRRGVLEVWREEREERNDKIVISKIR